MIWLVRCCHTYTETAGGRPLAIPRCTEDGRLVDVACSHKTVGEVNVLVWDDWGEGGGGTWYRRMLYDERVNVSLLRIKEVVFGGWERQEGGLLLPYLSTTLQITFVPCFGFTAQENW